jgi:hypothetical protein
VSKIVKIDRFSNFLHLKIISHFLTPVPTAVAWHRRRLVAAAAAGWLSDLSLTDNRAAAAAAEEAGVCRPS